MLVPILANYSLHLISPSNYIQAPGGTYVSFITPIGGSDGSEFLIGQDQTAAWAKVDWDEGKVGTLICFEKYWDIHDTT